MTSARCPNISKPRETDPFLVEEPAPAEGISFHGFVFDVAIHDWNLSSGEVEDARVGALVLSTLDGHEIRGNCIEHDDSVRQGACEIHILRSGYNLNLSRLACFDGTRSASCGRLR